MRNGAAPLVSAVVCAGLCVALMQAGPLSMLFLVPLGFSAAAYGPAVAWRAFLLATLGNGVLTLARSLGQGGAFAGAGVDILYFTVFALGFTWVMADNPPWPLAGRPASEDPRPEPPRVRTLFRFLAAAAVAALMFLVTSFGFERDWVAALVHIIEPIAAAYVASAAGGDAVRQSVLEYALAPERIVAAFVAMTLRGGALFSAAFLLFFSRQMAFLLARLFRRRDAAAGDLAGFFAPRRAIWFFSLAFPAILFGRALSVQAVEIAGWNLLVMCGLMFLAQGGGIVLFNLARRPMPLALRLLFGALFAVVVFSPGLNFVALAALLILGIAENWLPMRKAKREPPPA